MARVLSLLVGSLCGAAAAPAAPPRPEALISTLRAVGHNLPRDLLIQLYANAIKLSDFSGAANGTVLSGPASTASASSSRSALSLSTASAPVYADGSQYSDGVQRVWLCKRPVYPVSLLTQYGIPRDVAEEVNSRGYHAYVLHGTAPHTSLAYQFTSTNGWELCGRPVRRRRPLGKAAVAAAALASPSRPRPTCLSVSSFPQVEQGAGDSQAEGRRRHGAAGGKGRPPCVARAARLPAWCLRGPGRSHAPRSAA